MSHQELYYGFDSSKQKAYEKELKKSFQEKKMKGFTEVFSECEKKTKNWSKEEWQDMKSEGDAIYKALADACKQGLSPTSKEVQEIIRKHYQMIHRFYTPTKEMYSGLGQLYCEHPDFRKFYQAYDLEPEFLARAMKIFVERDLSS